MIKILEKPKGTEEIFHALQHLQESRSDHVQMPTISFEDFLKIVIDSPTRVIRNIFQIFHDMIKEYIGTGFNEYPDDPESIDYVFYDCSKLFVEGADNPFFADRLFANRLVNLVEALKRGTQQNKIYIFEGPHGCGKSTFLNNLLKKFEEYANTEQGMRYELVWKLDRNVLKQNKEEKPLSALKKMIYVRENTYKDEQFQIAEDIILSDDDHLEIVCPSHDNPLLIIPKAYRRAFFDDLLKNDKIKWKLFTEKEYEWVFKEDPCTICSSIYYSLLEKLKNPLDVLKMVYARPYFFNRRIGEGITVFNPGDKPPKNYSFSNSSLQSQMNQMLKNSNNIRYYYSRYAKTNNGVYALMDIKSNNTPRLIELHNIISDGVHKVEDIEENVHSLFIALMNPEDKTNIQDFPSFSDRIEYIKIPYVLDINTEIQIYRNIFGKHIDDHFLPRILHNFARVIVATRLSIRSEAMLEWINDPKKYKRYCDENLQLLKMEIYTGHIPQWLLEEDRKTFTAKRRRRIISESEKEGVGGFSGRDSIKIFNELYSAFAKEEKLITMSDIFNFFNKLPPQMKKFIPSGFLDSLTGMYNYTVLQEVKESLYYYNEEQISKDIQNYLFAVNFEIGSSETCKFTGDQLSITPEFLESIENRLVGSQITKEQRMLFRKETQTEYASKTLTQELMLEGIPIVDTDLYKKMYERYVHHLKEKVLDPFLINENFRRAVKDYEKEEFKTYDKRIRDDITFMIKNLSNKYNYSPKSSKEVCIYVIDNNLANQFANK